MIETACVKLVVVPNTVYADEFEREVFRGGPKYLMLIIDGTAAYKVEEHLFEEPHSIEAIIFVEDETDKMDTNPRA